MTTSSKDRLDNEFLIGLEELEGLQEDITILKELLENVQYRSSEVLALQNSLLEKYKRLTYLEETMFSNREIYQVLSMREQVNDSFEVMH